MVIGTVEGDVHDIGKNIVSMMFAGAGFHVIDLGIDVSAQKFVETVKRKNRISSPFHAFIHLPVWR